MWHITNKRYSMQHCNGMPHVNSLLHTYWSKETWPEEQKEQIAYSITGGELGKSRVVFDKPSDISPSDGHQLNGVDKLVNDAPKQRAIAVHQCRHMLLKQRLLLGFIQQLRQLPAVVFV